MGDLTYLFQEASWYVFSVLCVVFGYAAMKWLINTYLPERYITINHYHNDDLVSSHKIDLQSVEPLVKQLRRIQEGGKNG